MTPFWDPSYVVTVETRINGSKVQCRMSIDPETWEIEELREMVIQRMKQGVLHEIEEKLHWRIEAIEPTA